MEEQERGKSGTHVPTLCRFPCRTHLDNRLDHHLIFSLVTFPLPFISVILIAPGRPHNRHPPTIVAPRPRFEIHPALLAALARVRRPREMLSLFSHRRHWPHRHRGEIRPPICRFGCCFSFSCRRQQHHGRAGGLQGSVTRRGVFAAAAVAEDEE